MILAEGVIEMAVRKIIKIDEAKCNGCGICVPSCAEGALQIIDGKARLVKDQYCDGLGACLGECPQGALAVIERESEEFDEVEALKNLAQSKQAVPNNEPHQTHGHGGGCPGSRMMVLKPSSTPEANSSAAAINSELRQWPVQLHLVPVKAPYFQGADLLVAADCVAFAYADFHRKFLRGKTLVIACPKLDDTGVYREKLTQIIAENNLNSVTVVHMEVPCCFGLVSLVKEAMVASGARIPFYDVTVTINGEITQ